MKVKNILHKANEFHTIKEYMYQAVDLYNTKTAFILKNKETKEYTNISYNQFKEDFMALGTSLINLNLEDKRIAIIGENSYEWVISYVSIMCGVGISVPLDKGLQEDEIISSLQRSKANALIFSDKYIDLINKIKDLDDFKHILFISMTANNNFTCIPKLIENGKTSLINGNDKFENHKIDPYAIATIIFTSGTTSKSKAVMLCNNSIASNIYSMQQTETIYSSDVNLAFLPLHHTFGSTGLLLFLADGSANVFCDGLRHIQENLKEYKVTTFVCVPLLIETMYKKIMKEVDKQGKTKLIKFAMILSKILLFFHIDIRKKLFSPILNQLGGHIRFIISGASAIDKTVAKGFNDLGIVTVQGYGLTETSPVIAAENECTIKYGSVGLPLPGLEVKIDAPNENGIGEIIVKGDNIMLGYYEMPEETNKVIIDGWFHTGDLGYLGKYGHIFITGRKKNLIVLKNGKKIFPEELESIINKLPYVVENIVFGKEKDDDLLLSTKIVYDKDYIDKNFPNISENDLREIIWSDIKKINKSLPKYKYIKNMIITDVPMVKTTTAKIKRYEEIK